MRLRELLAMRGFALTARTKVVRHRDPTFFNLHNLRRDGWLETYQQYTANGTFERCEYIVSFLTEADQSNRWLGVFRVAGHLPSVQRPTPSGFPIPAASDWGRWFDLQRVSGFEDFDGRVVISWNGRIWHQWLNAANDPEIIQILPSGFVRPFPGYLELLLTFDDLRQIVRNPSANAEWHRMLAIPGVYLITDTSTGLQYVGSATGVQGIMGRWASYAWDGHGGNKQLRALLDVDPDHARFFQYSILRTLSPELHQKEGIRQEQLYKAKLGARAHGLNEN